MSSSINPNNINGAYPVAGQDNDSQGFRDNFTNIRNNFSTTKLEIEDLQNKAILTGRLTGSTEPTNDLAGTALKGAQLINTTETKVDVAVSSSGSATVDFSLGHLQVLTINTVSINLAFSTWPASSKGYAKARVLVKVENIAYTLMLPSTVNVGNANLEGSVANLDGTTTITFPSIGTYLFEFSSYDAGVNIIVQDLLRNFKENLSIFYDVTVGNLLAGNVLTVSSIGTTLGTGKDLLIDPDGNGNLVVGPTTLVQIKNTTTATSPNIAALVVDGGVGVQGNIQVSAYNQILLGTDLATGTYLPTATAQIYSNFPSYSQIAQQNVSNNPAASSDFIATADNGTDAYGFIDLGINSSGFNSSLFSIGKPNDGYLYVMGSPTTNGGNLLLGTGASGGDIVFFTGNTLAANEVARFSHLNQNLVVEMTTASTTSSTGALIVQGGVGVTGNINASANINSSKAFNTITGVLSTSSTTATLFNTTATTVNAFGAATTINVGASSGILTVNNANLTMPNATNFLIGGAATITSGTLTLTSSVIMQSTTQSTSSSSGALTVAGGLGVSKDLWVGGNIYVANVISVANQVLEVNDPLLYLRPNVVYPYGYDIGFYSAFVGGPSNVYAHTGLIRSETDGSWALFSNIGEPLNGQVDLTSAIYDKLVLGNILVKTSTGIVTDQTSVNLFNTTATTVNFAGAATTLAVGAATGTTTFNSTTTSTAQNTGAVVVSGGLGVASNINVGSSSSVSQYHNIWGNISVLNGNVFTTGNVTAGSLATPGSLHTFIGNVSVTGNITLSSNVISPSGSITLTSGIVSLTNGNIELTTGNIVMTSGNIRMTSGNIIMTNGNVYLATGNVNAVGATLSGAPSSTDSGSLVPTTAWVRSYGGFQNQIWVTTVGATSTTLGGIGVPAGVSKIKVTVIGAGGGGGGAGAAAGAAGAGGGGGAIATYYFSGVSTTSNTTSSSVGTGGTAGTNTGGTGGTGGNTVFQIVIGATTYTMTAGGGVGGVGTASASTSVLGGAGGSVSNTNLTTAALVQISGGYGSNSLGGGTAAAAMGGSGAPGFMGGGAGRGAGGVAAVGANGTTPGSGGGGAVGASFAGGTGANGAILIEY